MIPKDIVRWDVGCALGVVDMVAALGCGAPTGGGKPDFLFGANRRGKSTNAIDKGNGGLGERRGF